MSSTNTLEPFTVQILTFIINHIFSPDIVIITFIFKKNELLIEAYQLFLQAKSTFHLFHLLLCKRYSHRLLAAKYNY